MRRLLSCVAVVLMGVGALLARPIHADAATLTKVGWWSRTSDPASAIPRQASPGALPDAGVGPAAPAVPDGHLLAEGTPAGPTAIAALTYELRDRESSPVLTITPSQGSRTPIDMLLLACRASVDWAAPGAGPGRWQDKPLVDCTRSVSGILGDDGKITFALHMLISGPDLDVVLVPGVIGSTPGGGQVGSTFSLMFDASDGAAIRTVVTADASRPAAEDEAPAKAVSRAGPSVAAYVAPAAPVVAPALEPQEQAPVVPDFAQPADARPATESGSGRALGIAILVLGMVLFALSRLTAAADHDDAMGLGRFRRVRLRPAGGSGEEVVGGLGRFVRPRTRKPAALS